VAEGGLAAGEKEPLAVARAESGVSKAGSVVKETSLTGNPAGRVFWIVCIWADMTGHWPAQRVKITSAIQTPPRKEARVTFWLF
jgi:hypothetical protein